MQVQRPPPAPQEPQCSCSPQTGNSQRVSGRSVCVCEGEITIGHHPQASMHLGLTLICTLGLPHLPLALPALNPLEFEVVVCSHFDQQVHKWLRLVYQLRAQGLAQEREPDTGAALYDCACMHGARTLGMRSRM